MYRDIPPKIRQQVVDFYRAGTRINQITEATGLTRPTIYWVLRSEGVAPNRRPRNDQVSATELVQMLRETEQQLGVLKQENKRLKKMLNRNK
jgi:transposase-like protein